MKINGVMHYEQCYMHETCERSRDGQHVEHPEGTNGWRWGICSECGKECICNRLSSLRNEARATALRDAYLAVERAMYPNGRVDYTKRSFNVTDILDAVERLQ